MAHPHVAANELLVEMDEQELGKVREMNIPLTLSETPGGITGPSPRLGQHSQEILSGLGYNGAEIGVFKRERVI
jgi:formyl-CoA transferase/CoA:oxalate CoA-transferase